MGRGPKPTKSKEAKPPVARKSPKNDGSRDRDLEKRLEEALKEKAEALNLREEAQEQQAATAEILRVISSSPSDLQPVMQTIVENVVRLADADNAMIGRAEGDYIRWVAVAGTLSPERPHISHQPINRSLPSGRAIIDRQTTQVEDISVYCDEFPGVAAAYRKLGVRTILATPLLREGNSIGVILVRRTTVRPFTDQQIALLHTFADQAVIAIENVRLFKELQTSNRELTTALEQQSATSDILRVISGSPTDIQPVFDAILKRAATLCEAQLAHLWLYEGGEQFRLGAGYGSRPDHLEWLQQGLHRFGQPFFRESGPWRVGQVLDVRDTEPYRRGEPLWIRTADHEGMRTLLGVPLVKDGRLVGSIAVYRREVQPFTDQQTALVRTFDDQAVIAIENVRLFNETKEALERETATAEILRVISSSPTDIQPVFDAIVDSAARLCDAVYGVLL